MKTNSNKNWKNSINWCGYNRINKLRNLFISSGDIIIGTYEQKFLIPELFSRIDSMLKIFHHFIEVCDDKYAPILIDNAVKNCIQTEKVNSWFHIDSIGKNYLEAIKKQVNLTYINPIENFLKIYPNPNSINNSESFIELLQFTYDTCQSIVVSKDTLFHYNFKPFPIIRDNNTGKELVSLPQKDLDLIILPFSIKSNELYLIANATEKSIKLWRIENIKTQKEFLNFISSRQQLMTNFWSTMFQILMIILTITVSYMFVTLNDPIGVYKKNKELKEQIEYLQSKINN